MQIDSSTIGIITHDLKGPVGNVTMFSEMLVGMLESAQEELGSSYDLSTSIWYGQYIQLITSKYMDQLQNWADIYYILDGKAQFNPVYVDLSFLLSTVIKNNQLFIEKKKLSIETDIQMGAIFKTENDVFRRIFDNLIQLVVLLVGNEHKVKISLKEKNGKIVFNLSGLSLTDKPILEKLYVQKPDLANNHLFTKGLIKTTGIGLAFCNVAISHHKGTPFLLENQQTKALDVGFSLSNADE